MVACPPVTTAAALRSLPSRALRARWHGAFEIALFFVMTFAYEALRDMVAPSIDRIPTALRHADQVVSLESALGLHVEGSIQDATHAVPGLETFTTWFYALGHAPGYMLFFGALWWFRRAWYPFVRNWFWIGHGIAVLVFWVYPLAPPRLAALGLEDTTKEVLRLGGAMDWFEPFRNEFAAMPSFHMGYTFFFAAVGFMLLRGRRWRGVIFVWPLTMSWVTIATANHYWLDGVGGIAVMATAGTIAALVLARDLPRPWAYRGAAPPPAGAAEAVSTA